MQNITVGSVCSGIEAASVAWGELGFKFNWFSETAKFPSKILSLHYPETPNLGDMCLIPDLLRAGKIAAPDLICGGTPCQAFSLAGWKKGLADDRGNLTLKFVDIIEANDAVRKSENLPGTMIFWENVEGVLRDKTNAFGCLLASLAGFVHDEAIHKWPQSGLIRGPIRNIAWRVIDAKYFGLPQQRKRLYLIAGDKNFNPEEILFEIGSFSNQNIYTKNELQFTKNQHTIEVFRAYTDCLYSAYGTKWNGNAAAYNGSLFVKQGAKLRRFTPLECERLMGFPDDYTKIDGASATVRYQATGNSWPVPVVRWLGSRIADYKKHPRTTTFDLIKKLPKLTLTNVTILYLIGKTPISTQDGHYINGSTAPLHCNEGKISEIIETEADLKYFLTPAGCFGILRRKEERDLKINARLEIALKSISSLWTAEEINAISNQQTRGNFSKTANSKKTNSSSLQLW
jgi:DNA (cytosine-5)-methyltransferase 1